MPMDGVRNPSDKYLILGRVGAEKSQNKYGQWGVGKHQKQEHEGSEGIGTAADQ